MDDHQKGHFILVKPSGHSSTSHSTQHGTFLKITNSEPCQQKFQLPYNTKRDIGYKTLVGLNEQRKDEENSLCDVTLIIEDKPIRAHRAVLAVHSEYFRAMFTLGMMESRRKEVEMHDSTYIALSAAIEFIYTGTFVIWQEDLKDVLATACMLQLDSLIDLCVTELTNYLDVSNCLGMYKFAEMYSLLQLREKSEDLIKRCFYSVVREEEFAELDAASLTKIISWEGLNLGAGGCEDDVGRAVIRWYQHNPKERAQDVPMVMGGLRMNHVSSNVQSEIKTDVVLSGDNDMLTLLDSTNATQEARQFSHHIYAIGGYRQSRTGGQSPQAKSIEVLNTYTKHWQYCGPLPRSMDPETTLTMDGKLLMGKCCKSKDSEESWEFCSYNPVTNIWKVEHELQTLTSWLTWSQPGIGLKGFVKAYDWDNKVLYFCGSLLQKVGAPARRVFQYNMVNHAVKELPSLPESRFHHGAIVLKGKLYVIGGNDWETTAKDTTFMYDPADELWVTKQPMNIPRVGVGLAVVDGLLYAVGGTNMMARQRSAERYNPDTDEWTAIANMLVPRAFHGMAAAGGKIYVFGGKSYSKPEGGARIVTRTVEVYDPENNQWESSDSMHELRCKSYSKDAGARLVLQGSEFYDKDSNAWTAIGQMNQPHWRLVTCVL